MMGSGSLLRQMVALANELITSGGDDDARSRRIDEFRGRIGALSHKTATAERLRNLREELFTLDAPAEVKQELCQALLRKRHEAA